MWPRWAYFVVFATSVSLLVVLAGYRPERNELFRWGLGFLVWSGVALAAFLFWFSRQRRRGAESGLEELREALRFFERYSAYPLALGSIMGVLAAGALLCIPASPGAAPSERVVESVTVFLACLVGFVGVDAFYRRHAPITEMSVLLINLARDIQQAVSDAQGVVLVYPALNLGYYRVLKDHAGKIPDGHPYLQYRDAFSKAALQLGDRLRVMTYPEHLYAKLFRCYHEQVLNGRPAVEHMKGLEERATTEAVFLIGQINSKNLRVFSPIALPEGVAVAGEVVYMIHTYGMPQYCPAIDEDSFAANDAQGMFIPVEQNLADLVVYRRVDPLLARTVENHLERLASTADTQ